MSTTFWNDFSYKNPNQTDAFEEMSRQVFRRVIKTKDGEKLPKLHSDPNNKGLEAEPILSIEDNFVGFQAKWLQDTKAFYKEVKDTIKKSKEKYPSNLNIIYFFAKNDYTLKSIPWKGCLTLAKKRKVSIKTLCGKELEDELKKPHNFDLLQIYFGYGDEAGFIKNQLSSEKITEVLSLKETCLPLSGDQTISEIIIKLVDNQNTNLILLSGSAGSGKTVIARSVFCELSGLFEKNDTNIEVQAIILNKIRENGVIPMYISFKNCIDDVTLENLIRDRLNDDKLRGKTGNENLKFVYILDGLDEISEQKLDSTLSHIQILQSQSTTKSILISCRKASPNISNFKQTFITLQEVKISKLGQDFNKEFIKPLPYNERVVKDIDDIYTLSFYKKLLTKGYYPKTIFEIYKLIVDSYFDNLEYRKNLYKLNIPNLKKQQIIELNKKISYEYYKKFQFRFKIEDLQKIASCLFPKCSYNDINEIISYNASLFFDTDEAEQESYIYKHRKLQDYFFIVKLEEEYFKNRSVLRDFDILGKEELTNDFYNYIRNKYLIEIPDKKDFMGKSCLQGDLLKILEVNLSYLYLTGKNWWKEQNNEKFSRVYGNDEPHYIERYDCFIRAIASFTPQEFEELLEDEILDLKSKIIANSFTIKLLYDSGHQFYKILYDKFNKKPIKLKNEMDYNTQSDEEKATTNQKINDVVGDSFASYLWVKTHLAKDVGYINYLINKVDIDKDIQILKSLNNQKPIFYYIFDFLIKHNDYQKIENILISNNHLIIFCETVSNNLNKFIRNKQLEKLAKKKFKEFPDIEGLNVNFCKKILGLKSNYNLEDFPDYKKRNSGWEIYASEIGKFVYLSNLFGNIHNSNDHDYLNTSDTFYYLNNSGHISYKILYTLYIKLLFEEINEYLLFKTLVSKTNFIKSYPSSNLIVEIILQTKVFEDQKNIVNFIIENELVSLNYLLLNLRKNPSLFNFFYGKLNIKNELEMLENWQNEWHDHFEKSMDLIQLISYTDPYKAKKVLKKAISKSLLRHGWHKDIIVSHFLNNSLEILWKNKTIEYETLINYSDRVCKLNLKLRNRTDGDHTHWGKDEFLKIITEYDLELAIKYFEGERIKDSNLYNDSDYYGYVSIIVKKISLVSFDEEKVEKWLKLFNTKIRYNNYDHKVDKDFLHNKFEIYINIIVENKWLSEDYKNKKLAELNMYATRNDPEIGENLTVINIKEVLGFGNNLEEKIEIKNSNRLENLAIPSKINQYLLEIKPIDLTKELWNGGIMYYPNYESVGYFHTYKLVSALYKQEEYKQYIEDYLLKYSDYAGFPEIIRIWNELGETKKVDEYFLNFLEFCEFLLKN